MQNSSQSLSRASELNFLYKTKNGRLARESSPKQPRFRAVPYPAAQASKQALVIQGPQRVQLLHGCDQGFHWRGIHEVKGQQVIDAHGLE